MPNLEEMLRDIRAETNYACRMTGRCTLDDHVLDAISRVPRQEFVGQSFRPHAYENSPLPIGQGQTISQPFIVALMTDLLELKPEHKVLEVGTGSGYQTAVLAELCKQLYTVEIIPELAWQARHRLEQEGYGNIQYRTDNGYFGWPEAAPFDAIIVTAAAEEVPQPLVEQLAPGGRLVLPLGQRYYTQDLILLQKDHSGEVHVSNLLPVSFVPLTGDR
ncbi:MAG: protein-L-isoaspartate(D-aspartate) O-methyltransferase [Candidatus Thiodiazotropha sp.]